MSQSARDLSVMVGTGSYVSLTRSVLMAMFLAAGPAMLFAQVGAEAPPSTHPTRVPRWDARGLGRLPWQGVSCVDMTSDGRYVAVGTIAPPGDPQAFVLDENGKIVEQQEVGARWVEAVAVGERVAFLATCCGVPAGTSGDRPAVRVFVSGKEMQTHLETPTLNPADGLFHYGAHSNHLPQIFAAVGDRLAVASRQRLTCLNLGAQAAEKNDAQKHAGSNPGGYGKIGPCSVTRFAVNGAGRAVIGLAVRQHERTEQSRDLILLDADKPAPLWARPVNEDVVTPPAIERGVYGPHVSAPEDAPVWAPLAVAIDRPGRLVAAADYQGWQRRFYDSKFDYGVRFVPTRPVIHVYDEGGKELRRFGPESFDEPFWCDLAFSADGKRLLVFPHCWTSRGLGGLGILPADDNACTLYRLDIDTGQVDVRRFPDAISSAAIAGDKIVVGCWDHRVYMLDEKQPRLPALAEGIDVGAASLIRAADDGSRILVAGVDGVVRMLAGDGRRLWRTDLNKSAKGGDKPWTRNQRLTRPWTNDKASELSATGVWKRAHGRTHSDMGGQYLIEAPEGLLLIEANGGLSIEQTWAEIEGSGFDPMQIKYVLLTHEHGDHAPGAHLWRVLTGAQVVASAEMAYTMAHHLPIGTGYGFNPPQPVDVVVDHDQELTLAGLKVQVLRTPGHTAGSLGYAFRKDGKLFVSLGDLIMPGGNLGYFGSLSFSPQDVLDSLRKLAALKPDFILGGHGTGDPDWFIAAGIAAGEATGWSKMPPIKPDPYHRLTPGSYQVVAWLEKIVSVDYGDFDGDGLPDVTVLVQEGDGAKVKVYLNRRGKFNPQPEFVYDLPDFSLEKGGRVCLIRLSGGTATTPLSPSGRGAGGEGTRRPLSAGKLADVLVASEQRTTLLLSTGGKIAAQRVDLPIRAAVQAFPFALGRDSRPCLLVGQRFSGNVAWVQQHEDGSFRATTDKNKLISYHNLILADLNRDGSRSLVTSAGEVFLNLSGNSLPPGPSLRLEPFDGKEWTCVAAADFNGDGWPDLAFTANGEKDLSVAVYYHTKNAKQPYGAQPTVFSVPGAKVPKDGPGSGDWNRDGFADLVLGGQKGAIVLLGSAEGLRSKQRVEFDLDYRRQGEDCFTVGNFNGDGRIALAGWGQSYAGAIGVYICSSIPK